MNISQQVVILSAETENRTALQNKEVTKILKHCLEDCNMMFGEALGSYKGRSEASFVVIVNHPEEITALKGFAFTNFNQESILYQDANQEAYLLLNDGTEKRLGRLEEVPLTVALKQDSFTLFGGRYFITKQRPTAR